MHLDEKITAFPPWQIEDILKQTGEDKNMQSPGKEAYLSLQAHGLKRL